MLTHHRLLELHRGLADRTALSIYVDGDQHDPAERRKWRLELEHGLAGARAALDPGERQAFTAAERRVLAELESFDAFLPGKAYVAFATPDRLWYGESLGVAMPHLVRWGPGIAAAPYLRGLEQERPVVVALLDSERARVFLFQDGSLRETEDLRADTFQGDLTDVGASNRAGTATGQRGMTSTDLGQRNHAIAGERMVKELAERVARAVGDSGFLVLGGTPEMESRLQGALPKSCEGRVVVEPSLHVLMTEAELREAVGELASTLTRRTQLGGVRLALDQARAGQRGALGYRETLQALEEMRVETLFVSRAWARGQTADTERLIGLALAGAARVEEVGGEAGELLDREAEGIAARLRYRPTRESAGTEQGAVRTAGAAPAVHHGAAPGGHPTTATEDVCATTAEGPGPSCDPKEPRC